MSLLEAPVVGHVVRNDVVESVHHGLGVITAPDGSVEFAVGDPETLVFARSSNKPLQALAMLHCGLDMPPEYLAMVCSSHSGEPPHVQRVGQMLAGAGLDVSALDNTPDLPWNEDARNIWLAQGRGKESIAQNCSGKHAGMLATCVVQGWDTATYRDASHPLQVAISETLVEMYGAQVSAMAVDGCGAPAHQLPLVGLARAYGLLGSASDGARRKVAYAMRAHPECVGGTGRAVTQLMRDVPGIIAKDGAEGVFAVGLSDGHGVAVKIADGSARAATVLVAALLSRLGLPDAALARLADSPVMGHGEPVGSVVAAFGVDA